MEPTQYLDYRGALFHAVPLDFITEHNNQMGEDALFGYTNWSDLSNKQKVYVEFEITVKKAKSIWLYLGEVIPARADSKRIHFTKPPKHVVDDKKYYVDFGTANQSKQRVFRAPQWEQVAAPGGDVPVLLGEDTAPALLTELVARVAASEGWAKDKKKKTLPTGE